jgi:hypothetical protein
MVSGAAMPSFTDVLIHSTLPPPKMASRYTR